MYQNLTLEQALKNEEFVKIMNAASYKYKKYIDPSDLESLQMETLWQCLIKYDEKSEMKFTTYLYTNIVYDIIRLVKKKKKKIVTKNYENIFEKFRNTEGSKDRVNSKIKELLMMIKEEDRDLLEKRFFHNMTTQQIGQINGYSKETARKKINNLLSKCSKII